MISRTEALRATTFSGSSTSTVTPSTPATGAANAVRLSRATKLAITALNLGTSNSIPTIPIGLVGITVYQGQALDKYPAVYGILTAASSAGEQLPSGRHRP